MKTYKFEGFGNYSKTYNWDDGIGLSDPELTDEKFEPDPIMFMGMYVREIQCNEHGGSRNITLLVQAYNEEDAVTYATLYCSKYYPAFGFEEEMDCL